MLRLTTTRPSVPRSRSPQLRCRGAARRVRARSRAARRVRRGRVRPGDGAGPVLRLAADARRIAASRDDQPALARHVSSTSVVHFFCLLTSTFVCSLFFFSSFLLFFFSSVRSPAKQSAWAQRRADYWEADALLAGGACALVRWSAVDGFTRALSERAPGTAAAALDARVAACVKVPLALRRFACSDALARGNRVATRRGVSAHRGIQPRVLELSRCLSLFSF